LFVSVLMYKRQKDGREGDRGTETRWFLVFGGGTAGERDKEREKKRRGGEGGGGWRERERERERERACAAILLSIDLTV
jgi:hypothetical protein